MSTADNALGLDAMWPSSTAAASGSPSLPSYYSFGSAGGTYGYSGEGVGPHEQPTSFDAPAASGGHGGYDGAIGGPATSMSGLWPAFTPCAALPQSWERSSFNSTSSLAQALNLPHLGEGRGSVASIDSTASASDTTGPVTPAEGLRRTSYQIPIFTPADTASTAETGMSLFPASPEAPKRAISGPVGGSVGSPPRHGSPHLSSIAQSAPSYQSFSFASPRPSAALPQLRSPLVSQQSPPAPSFTDPWAGFRSQHGRASSVESTGEPMHGSPRTGPRHLPPLDESSANGSPYLGGSPQLGSMPPPPATLQGRRPYSRVGSFDGTVRSQLQSMQLQRLTPSDDDEYEASTGPSSLYNSTPGMDLPILSDVDMRFVGSFEAALTMQRHCPSLHRRAEQARARRAVRPHHDRPCRPKVVRQREAVRRCSACPC